MGTRRLCQVAWPDVERSQNASQPYLLVSRSRTRLPLSRRTNSARTWLAEGGNSGAERIKSSARRNIRTRSAASDACRMMAGAEAGDDGEPPS